MRIASYLVAVALGVAISPGCKNSVFRCSGDDSCMIENVSGTCEASGYCAFPDEECASGRRYGEQAPAEVAGTCVGPEEDPGPTETATGVEATDTTGWEDSSSRSGTTSVVHSDIGGSGNESTGRGEPTVANVVFISSQGADRAATDFVADADQLCNTLASDSGLDGTYVAWLSTTSEPAIDRLEGARGWVRPDGRPFADTSADIVAGRIYYPPLLDERGEARRFSTAMTGTAEDGLPMFNCDDWSELGDEAVAVGGDPGSTFPTWTSLSTSTCGTWSTELPVYCFGIDHESEVTFEPVDGRRAFTTGQPVTTDRGLSGFDQRCQLEASAVGLSGSFRAFVSGPGISAIDRFDVTDGPWVNMLGVPLTSNASDLVLGGDLEAPANFSAAGDAIVGAFWTGAASPSSSAGQNCSGWTGTGEAQVGLSGGTTDWFNGLTVPCDLEARVLCFEQ